MAIRIRKNGKIFCAALNKEEPGDCYLDDGIHYMLSVERKVLVTTENDIHMTTGGEWWWKGQEPKDIMIDKFYYESNTLMTHDQNKQRDEYYNREKLFERK